MDDVKYFGLYSTLVGAVTVSLLSEGQDNPRFPPGISYKDNNYRFIRYYRASSPKQLANLRDWAEKSNIETDISLNL